jgi:uncharacterized protein (DUF488 family)
MRSPAPGASRNLAWKEEGFRAYADHMQTSTFDQAWELLARQAAELRCVAMCAEAQPLHCHRQLLADAFVARGWEVWHILSREQQVAHRLTPTAVVDSRGRVHYPGTPELPFGETAPAARPD